MPDEYAQSDYVSPSSTTVQPVQKTVASKLEVSGQPLGTKAFLKSPMLAEDLARYGLGKPRRIVVRAKLIP